MKRKKVQPKAITILLKPDLKPGIPEVCVLFLGLSFLVASLLLGDVLAVVGVILAVAAFAYYWKVRRVITELRLTPHGVQKIVIQGNDEPWQLRWNTLTSVSYDWGKSSLTLIASQQEHTHRLPVEQHLIPYVKTVGRYLSDDSNTELARPFRQTEANTAHRSGLLGIVIIHLLVIPLLLVASFYSDKLNFPLTGLAFVANLAGAGVLSSLITYLSAYHRASLAIKLPQLTDPDRDIELEIYEDFNEDADAAGRFYRHVWSHDPQSSWFILPLKTRKRLLATAKNQKNLPNKTSP